MVRLQPRRYDLPGGSVGRRFVDILAREVTCVATQKENSEQLVVFQVLMLQREPRTTKGADVRRLLTKRMDLWENCAFDTLVQEALRCSESLQKSSSRKSAEQRKRP